MKLKIELESPVSNENISIAIYSENLTTNSLLTENINLQEEIIYSVRDAIQRWIKDNYPD